MKRCSRKYPEYVKIWLSAAGNPTSQMVGTQAVLNVITGERYKMVPAEVRAYVRANMAGLREQSKKRCARRS